MKSTREQFEEIWPVPRGIMWDGDEYLPLDLLEADQKYFELSCEWDARLDTFTRCQESMGPVLSIIEELIESIESNWCESFQLDAVRNARGYLEKHK